MRKLPEVLAGPIVRRSTVDEVNVWLATSVPLLHPELRLYDPDGYQSLPAHLSTRTVRMGLQLYVHMCSAVPDGGEFPAGTPIGYDISVAGRSLATMMDFEEILLPGFQLPTFLLQLPDVGQLHALYGSCRKLHGPQPDLMRGAEQVLVAQRDGRPEVFFLGGDQIYADDVSHLLIREINDLSLQLVGWPEVIPGMPGPAQAPDADRGAFLKYGGAKAVSAGRGGAIRPLEHFTSGEMKHHLLTFGEFAATYLLAWNPQLWRRPAAPGQLGLPVSAARGVRAARRVLANVVTYMTFDDHEITDDWFRTPEWQNRVLSKSWGERIIVNGLCAYWAFQGWGNEPARYRDDFLDTMAVFARRKAASSMAHKLLLGWRHWSYVAPTSPPALVLDTRTHRGSAPDVKDRYPRAELDKTSPAYLKYGSEPMLNTVARNTEAPRLIDSSEWRRLHRKLADASASAPLIVIAASPVFGFRPLEEIQETFSALGPDSVDLESWAANPRNLADLVWFLIQAGVDYTVILSGDVHYGFELAATVATARRTIRVAQLCSSALKNAPVGFQLHAMKVLRHFATPKYAMAWWDFGSPEVDRAITKYWVRSLKQQDLKRAHGNPSFTVSEQLQRGGDRSAVITDNNVGELKVDDQGLSNRFWWSARPGHFAATAFTRWQIASWPVDREWPEHPTP
ncbi:MAG: alkaline phosphatase D family protein [Actinomycetota bacterium]|nr:alkaline phosphatase D family protein [Actinomycetota bacterium]